MVYTYAFQGDSWMRRTAVETDGGNTVTTNFLYDGDNAVAEFDGSYNLTAHHVTNGLDRTLWSVRGTCGLRWKRQPQRSIQVDIRGGHYIQESSNRPTV
jgi:hypothetical protein